MKKEGDKERRKKEKNAVVSCRALDKCKLQERH